MCLRKSYHMTIMCVYVYLCSFIPGMECDVFDNPADFFLDKLNEAENDLKPPDPESKYLQGIQYILCISQS